jgi:type I restriction enzyme R subunit
LFGPGQHKQFFYLFDYCQNLEFFSQNPETTEGSLGESLGKRLFNARLELIGEIDHRAGVVETTIAPSRSFGAGEPTTDDEVRHATAELLYRETAAMNLENFVVRSKRRVVEKYAVRDAWETLSPDSLLELSHEVAGLPSELDAENEEAKRFDLLILNLQLAILRAEPGFVRMRDQVIEIAGLLEEKESIPMVRQQMPLIQDVQSGEWWQDVTIPMLESLRRRLRDLVKFIEKGQRRPIYTDFEDELGVKISVDLPGFADTADDARFRAKAQAFLRAHQDHITVHKLRMNASLTVSDLAELERMLVESGVGEQEDIRRAAEESQGLGLFVRSLVGMDRGAAKEALAGFLAGKTMTASQIEFVNLIINHLTEHGVIEPSLLYESPFTDLTPHGPDGIFSPTQVDELMAMIEQIRSTALAA